MTIKVMQLKELLVTYLRPHKFKVIILGIILISNIGLQIFNPQLIGNFLDMAKSQASLSTLLISGLIFLGLSLLQQLLLVGESYISEDVGWSATNDLRSDLTRHVLKLDYSFHTQFSPGELIERVDGDINELSNFFSQFFLRVIGNTLFILGVVVVFFLTDWRLGFALAIFCIFSFVIISLMRNFAVKEWALSHQANANLYSFLEERLNGIEDIKANGGKNFIINKLSLLMNDLLKKFRTARLRGNFSFIVFSCLFVFGEAIALSLGSYLYFDNLITLGTVFLLHYYILTLINPLHELTNQVQDLQKAMASISRVLQIKNTPIEIKDGPVSHTDNNPASLNFQNVSFSYANSEKVLKNLTFSLEAGEVVGVLGPSGSGKTSLVRLLLRLYDFNEGAIKFGNYNIKDLSLETLRNQIGFVTQDVQLFKGSIRENLTLLNEDISDEQLNQLVRELGFEELFKRFPNGFDTMIDSNGGGLSAGEAQLIAFIRVAINNPNLIIMDEASSRLDPITQRIFQKAASKLLHGRTGIIIAHRLSAVMDADKILILDKGEIREFGSRMELQGDSQSYFYKLLRQGNHEVIK
ncbi:ABC transporter ATP-binding protein [Paenibacillus illinoisensis]|uniref:ABC transporter ATP-binding protein n=1 Tax=Paenibacillus illinoisensis TaxID=59845 RepID=UPI0030167605